MNSRILFVDFTEQLNRLAEAFHKYEIDEVRTREGAFFVIVKTSPMDRLQH